MFQHLNLRSFLWMVTLYTVLIIGTLGCSRDDDNWVGTWSLETVDGQSYGQLFAEDFAEEEDINFSIVTNKWTFNSDGTMEIEIAVKFTGEIDGVDVSASISAKGTGTYSLSDANYTLTFTSGTTVITTPEGVETEPFTEEDGDEDTGTWARDGSTLTLFSDEGETIVFKKR